MTIESKSTFNWIINTVVMPALGFLLVAGYYGMNDKVKSLDERMRAMEVNSARAEQHLKDTDDKLSEISSNIRALGFKIDQRNDAK